MTAATPPKRAYLVKRSHSTPEESSTVNDFGGGNLSSSTPTTATSGKMVALKVLLLDDSVTIIQAQTKALGRLVFDQICKQLNVLESDYFGLEYCDQDTGVLFFLDLEKRMNRQVGFNLAEPVLKFVVKFYTPDPSQLEEEFTRYLFSLQIKRDLASGVLQCNDNTAALMASFIVQAECGDFSEEDYPDASYLSMYKFIPGQTYEIERKIRECHKKHVGQSPAEADLHLLETARRTEISGGYGIRFYPARDEDGVSLTLSVCHSGILVFQNGSKMNTFSWAKIRKISFKRKRFILKLHPETYGYYKELVEFIFDSRNECKAFWKKCVEHHAFFRCEKAPNPVHRSKGILSSRGSSFRYSGRTQKQMVQFVRENFVKRPVQQYLSQQNLSSYGTTTSAAATPTPLPNNNEQQRAGEQFQRSSSFKKSYEAEKTYDDDDGDFSDYNVQEQETKRGTSNSNNKSPQHSSSCSSPTLLQQEDGEDKPSQELALVPKGGRTPQQTQQQQNLDFEATYYKWKQVLNMFRTFVKDLALLASHLPQSGLQPLLTSSQHFLTTTLQANITGLKKHEWELRNGLEILYKLNSYFVKNEGVILDYLGYVKEHYEQICSTDTNDYIPLCCLCLKPYFFCLTLLPQVRQLQKNPRGGNTLPFLSKLRKLGVDQELISTSKVCELRREVNNCRMEELKQSEFLRQGVVLKLNKRRGLQTRIAFLFVDYLLYCTRISSQAGFRLHGLIPTSQMELDESNESTVDTGIPHSFLINVQSGGNGNGDNNGNDVTTKVLVLAGVNDKEKQDWLSAIALAIQKHKAGKRVNNNSSRLSCPVGSSSEETFNNCNLEDLNRTILATRQPHYYRSNATTHVCWHRNLSVDAGFIRRAYTAQMSSYLLRKFKSSPGWQRLWVCYSNVCLYFYKNHEQSSELLASLPLLGYSISIPSEEEMNADNENVRNNSHVFKLSFKQHLYYFRAESEYSLKDWYDTISYSIKI